MQRLCIHDAMYKKIYMPKNAIEHLVRTCYTDERIAYAWLTDLIFKFNL